MSRANDLPVSDDAPMPITDYYLNVAKGKQAGVSYIHKYGRNPDIDTADGFEAIWNGGGDYTGHNITAPEILETFSSSVTDVGNVLSTGVATGGTLHTLVDTGATFVTDGVTAGDVVINDTLQDHAHLTGVTETTLSFLTMAGESVAALGESYRVVTQGSTGVPIVKLLNLITTLDVDSTVATEYIVLNGITPVDTVGTYVRHDRGRSFGGTNAGEITTRQKTTPANVTMVMPIGYNSTMISAYTVPFGKRAYILSWYAAVSRKGTVAAGVRLMTSAVNCDYKVIEELAIHSQGSGYVLREYKIPKDSIPPLTDIKVMADVDANASGIAAGFDLLLVDA